MPEKTIDIAQVKAARVAGIAYLLTLAIVVIANFTVTFRFIVPGNIVESTRNILAHEQLFRLNVALDLIYAGGILVLLTALYLLLAPRGKGLAILGGLFRSAYALMWIVISLSLLSVLRLLTSGENTILLETDRLPGLALVFLGVGSNAYTLGLVFWGAASALCAFQLLDSGFIPKALALWGIISSVWCSLCGIGVITIPGFSTVVDPNLFDVPMLIFEIVTAILFIRLGARHNLYNK